MFNNMNKFVISVLLFSSVFCLVQAEDSDVTRAMKEHRIIPDVIKNSVPQLLQVTFEDDVTAYLGKEITPFQTRNQPKLDWTANESDYHTLVTLDPDAPEADNPFNALLNTWMVGNIPGKDVGAGEVLFEYLPSATPSGVGFNRYAVCVYKQPGKLEFDEERIDDRHFQGREKFDLERFVSKYNLEGPVSCNFYKSQYDPYVLLIYAKLGCCFEYNKF